MTDSPRSKFSVRVHDPKAFTRAFKLAAGCASHRPKWGGNLPTEHVLLRVAGFKALLLATDLCQYLTIDLGLAGGGLTLDGEGALFLPADWKVPREPFRLEYEPTDTGPKVTLKFGAVEQDVPQAHDPQEWPLFPLGNAGCKFDLPAQRLAHELNTLAPMCAAEKGRYALNGIFFEFDGIKPEDAGPFFRYQPPFKAHMVATDGRHLGMTTLPVTFTMAPPRFQALLDHSYALNVSKIMLALETDENVEVAFSPEVEETNDKGEITEVRPHENLMFFGTRAWNYSVRMVEGQFPDWHSVVPKTDATVLLDREAFIEALQAVKHACSVESTAVKLTFNADHLLIEAKSVANGYAKTQILLDEVPPQMQLGLDPEYLIEACTALTGDTIVFQFRSCEHGVSIHDGAPELRYQLVMPIDFGDRPVEPKEPELDIKDEVWDGKAGAYVKVSDEAKALAKAEYDAALEKHKQDLETWKVELARWRLNNRRNAALVDGEDSDEEQKFGEFTPRPADQPQIGQKLGHVPTLDELHARALTADPVVKPKKKPAAKAAAPAQAPVRTEAEPQAAEEHIQTARELGYTVNKDQQQFGW